MTKTKTTPNDIADMFTEQGITIVLWKEDYARCVPRSKLIFLPVSFFDANKKNEIVMSLLHELGHIQHTTYDIAPLIDNDQELFVLNCVEDVRVDTKLLLRDKVSGMMYDFYFSLFRGKTIRSRPFYKCVCWATMIKLLKLQGVATIPKAIEDYIAEEEIPLCFGLIGRMLDVLQYNKSIESQVKLSIKLLTSKLMKGNLWKTKARRKDSKS